MVSVETATCVYAKIDNRPGSLERLARVFNDRRVNIDAVSLETAGSSGFVRIQCQRPREIVDALRAIGIESYESPSLVASLPNKPGQLFSAAGDMAAAGINIESVYTTPDGRIVFRTSDNDRASAVLRKL